MVECRERRRRQNCQEIQIEGKSETSNSQSGVSTESTQSTDQGFRKSDKFHLKADDAQLGENGPIGGKFSPRLQIPVIFSLVAVRCPPQGTNWPALASAPALPQTKGRPAGRPSLTSSRKLREPLSSRTAGRCRWARATGRARQRTPCRPRRHAGAPSSG